MIEAPGVNQGKPAQIPHDSIIAAGEALLIDVSVAVDVAPADNWWEE